MCGEVWRGVRGPQEVSVEVVVVVRGHQLASRQTRKPSEDDVCLAHLIRIVGGGLDLRAFGFGFAETRGSDWGMLVRSPVGRPLGVYVCEWWMASG